MERLSKFVGIRGGVSKRAFESLLAFRREVEEAFNPNVKDVVLFGSRARGDAKRESDYDVAIMFSGSDAGTAMDRKLSNLAYPYIFKGLHITPVSVPEDFIHLGDEHPLAFSVAREGIVIS